MNTKIVLLALITIILSSCNKSKSSKPQLTFVSVNQTNLNAGDILTFNLNFTDQAGEVDTLFINRVSKVCSDTANTGWHLDSTSYPTLIPSYPSNKNQKGSLIVNFDYNTATANYPLLNACILIADGATAKTDTSYFQFCLKDANGLLSDTVKSPKITFNK